jgi:hypothetical protein
MYSIYFVCFNSKKLKQAHIAPDIVATASMAFISIYTTSIKEQWGLC